MESKPWEKLKCYEVDFSVEELVEGLQKKKYTNIVFVTGAGISVSAGIPDFRTPETGLYARLAYMKLPHPEDVFNIKYFRKNPKAFYEAERLTMGYNAKPVTSHYFQRIIQDKGMLRMIFTQNVDGLEIDAGFQYYYSS